MRPKPHWLESTRFRHGCFANVVSQVKTRSCISISPRWRHAETSRCLVCCTDRYSDAARGTSGTCFSPPRRRFQKHSKQLCWHPGPRHLQMLARSALGLVDVYNLLLKHVVEQKSVAAMQHELQMLLKFRASNGDDSWLHTFSLRVPLSRASVASFFLRLRAASFLAVALQSLLVACG